MAIKNLNNKIFEEAGKNGRVQKSGEKVENPANLKRKQKKPLQI
jgi:hypothetical protein